MFAQGLPADDKAGACDGVVFALAYMVVDVRHSRTLAPDGWSVGRGTCHIVVSRRNLRQPWGCVSDPKIPAVRERERGVDIHTH